MDYDLIAAAVLTAAFVNSQRQALSSGRVDDAIREKFIEYLEFVRAQRAPPAKSARAGKKRG